jgi:multiple sugar transport system substrate-binding protein
MSNDNPFRREISRRRLLQGGAGLAMATALGGYAPTAQAAGGKVIIGAFADGGLTPFKEKIIPLAKAEGGFDVEFLEDEYGVTLE